MIGGVDIALPGLVLVEDVDLLLRVARAAWPQAIVENGDGTVVERISDAIRRPWEVPCEIFIYENRAAYDSWTEDGLTDQNANTIVSVTAERDCLSFVVGEATGPTASIVKETMDAVKTNRSTLAAA